MAYGTNNQTITGRYKKFTQSAKGGPWVLSQDSGQSERVVSQGRTGTKTPGWPRLKTTSVGLPVINNYSFSINVVNGAKGFLEQPCNPPTVQVGTRHYGQTRYQGLGSDGSLLAISAAEETALDNRVANDILQKCKHQQVNLLQAYAERCQTADLMASTATRIYNTIRYLRKGEIGKAANEVGVKISRRKKAKFNKHFAKDQKLATASGWLQLQYGWEPLLNDVYGSAEAIAEAENKQMVAKVQSSKKLRREKSTFDNTSANWNIWGESETELTIKYVVYFSVDPGLTRTLAQVGITNPALIAWELLPFSFVADWFIPIGNYISNWDATLGCTFGTGCKTRFIKQSGKSTWIGARNGWSGSTTGSTTYVAVTRTKLLTFPSARPPSFKNPMSFDHVANAMALFYALFRR